MGMRQGVSKMNAPATGSVVVAGFRRDDPSVPAYVYIAKADSRRRR
jgi:hypothetical protein